MLFPALGFLFNAFFGYRAGRDAVNLVGPGMIFLAFAITLWGFARLLTMPAGAALEATLWPWIAAGRFHTEIALRMDALSAVMTLIVSGVGAVIHLYSIGYMAHDEDYARYFAYMNLFALSMLVLVLADNLLLMFVGWEGVGLCSYLLIAFWYDNAQFAYNGRKAFVVNRVGDAGFVLGIMTTFWAFGSIRFAEIFPQVAAHAHAVWRFGNGEFRLIDLACCLLFIGAMGKSAQFLLHTWLPDAMEGPTPVSALIHAATMVTAGVYMVCLLSPMFEYAPIAKDVVTVVGAVTALFAATIGLAQNDIKRVVAYSTCSQLGYMFFAAGVGAYPAAMFHLFTHAFFKALLFLGAGAVINAVHHEQDMRKMGGLYKVLPITYAIMLIGTLSITGVGIPGLDLGFSGFYSKDAIINAAFVAGRTDGAAGFAFFAGLIAAGLTSFYSWRLIFMTFHGTPKWGHAAARHDDHADAGPAHADAGHADQGHGDAHGHGDEPPREAPWNMRGPLLLLALGAVAAGGVFAEAFIGPDRADFWRGAIFNLPTDHILDALKSVPPAVVWGPLVVTAIGFAAAWYAYIRHEGMGARLARGPIWAFLYNKWYFDELYDFIFVRGAKALGDLFWKGGDKALIDGLGPDGVSAVSMIVGKATGRLQTGYVYHYAFVMLLGIAGLLSFGLWVFR